jgi:hypothetical protein
VRERAIGEFPTWMNDSGALVTDPIWLPAFNSKWSRTYQVK